MEIYATPEWLSAPRSFELPAIPVHEISGSDLQRISFLSTANQVLGLFRIPRPSEPVPSESCLLLEGIQDPGNLGTIIRCADWFGVRHVLASRDTADAFAPKVVQSAMGSLARVSIEYTDLNEWVDGHPQWPVWAASLDGEDLFAVGKPGPLALLIGNESKGISREMLEKAARQVRIPGKGSAESLNAAVAAGILLAWLT